jgi:hypothetical protein
MKRIEWAPYREEDYPWVLSMHVEQERMLGRGMDLPDLNERPVISAYVGRVDGKIVACVFAEAEIEVCALAEKALPKADIQNVAALLTKDAQRYQIRLARAFVPTQAPKAVKRILAAAGFTEVDESMTDFYRWIPQREG